MKFERGSMFLAAMAAVCVGCGGGKTGGSASGPAPQAGKLGNAVFSYFGQPKPQTATGSGNVTVLGQAGATFSTVTLEPPPNLADTYLVLSREAEGQESLYKYSYPKGAGLLLHQGIGAYTSPGISAYGTIAFFDQGANTVYSVRDDGTGLTPISFNVPGTPYGARYATDGTNRLAFEAGALYVGPGTGGAATEIQAAESGYSESWNPAGTQIAYINEIDDLLDLWQTPTSGGGATDITPVSLKGTGNFFYPVWAPDGLTIYATFQPSSSNQEIMKIKEGQAIDITSSGDQETNVAVSPDGSKLAVYRTSTNGQTPGIYIEDATGYNASLFIPDPANAQNSGNVIGWSPFLPKETVISATASTFFHKAASGFLLSQNSSQFGSLVAFTATTPADAAIQSPATSGTGAPLAFTITADSITSIGYINDYFSPGTTITLTSTPSVVVTIDASTGQVDLVAPAADANPSVTKNLDGTVTYGATFKAVYNGKGQNLAGGGAHQVTVDPKTGHLVRLE